MKRTLTTCDGCGADLGEHHVTMTVTGCEPDPGAGRETTRGWHGVRGELHFCGRACVGLWTRAVFAA